jgi:hypothetical protein
LYAVAFVVLDIDTEVVPPKELAKFKVELPLM